jgi:hypothetical protein
MNLLVDTTFACTHTHSSHSTAVKQESRVGENEEAVLILWSEMLTQVYYQREVNMKT